MRYHLTVQRLETNEHYDAELKDWQQRANMRHYPGPEIQPQKEKSILALEVILDQVEFSHLKRQIMEIFQ